MTLLSSRAPPLCTGLGGVRPAGWEISKGQLGIHAHSSGLRFAWREIWGQLWDRRGSPWAEQSRENIRKGRTDPGKHPAKCFSTSQRHRRECIYMYAYVRTQVHMHTYSHAPTHAHIHVYAQQWILRKRSLHLAKLVYL